MVSEGVFMSRVPIQPPFIPEYLNYKTDVITLHPATEINTMEVCPVCHGTGKISSSVVIDEAIERRLTYYVNEKKITDLKLKVSPILGSYLTRGLFSSILGRWKKKYKCKIELVEVTDFTVLQNEFYNAKGDKLD